jgi:hypothetical protein
LHSLTPLLHDKPCAYVTIVVVHVEFEKNPTFAGEGMLNRVDWRRACSPPVKTLKRALDRSVHEEMIPVEAHVRWNANKTAAGFTEGGEKRRGELTPG